MKMSFGKMSESHWEAFAMDTLGELAWHTAEGRAIAPGSGERESWDELIIPHRVRDAIARINPQLPRSAVDEAFNIVLTAKSRDPRGENRQVHEYLTKGIRSVGYTDAYGAEQNPTIHLINRRDLYANDFLAVSQVTVIDEDHKRRFDIVLYVNGMPLGIIELKNAGSKDADLKAAHAQLMTYVEELPLAFRCNVACVISDGITAGCGTAFTTFEHFAPWNVDEQGEPVAQPPEVDEDLPLCLILHGLFEQGRFIELLNGYVAFARSDSGLIKRLAKPHQYFAVAKAVDETIKAVRSDGHAGVVWHTQGPGKSLEMELYANQVLTHPSLGNPTIVVLTDRTDLDDQLYDTFEASELLPDEPHQVATRDELRGYIHVYDLTRAVDDGATVPVFYESRLIPVDLPADVDPGLIDERADEATAGLDDSERERIQQAVAVMNALYGARTGCVYSATISSSTGRPGLGRCASSSRSPVKA